MDGPTIVVTVRPSGSKTPLLLRAGTRLGKTTAGAAAGSMTTVAGSGGVPVKAVLDAGAVRRGQRYAVTLVATAADGSRSGLTVTFAG